VAAIVTSALAAREFASDSRASEHRIRPQKLTATRELSRVEYGRIRDLNPINNLALSIDD
jgi:hypothetical protein